VGRFALTLRNDWRMRGLMSEGDRVIAEVRDYAGFTAALRAWITKLNTNYECINDIAGLPSGYLAKLISATPVRSFSRISLGSTLGAMGLKLLLAVDHEKLAAMRPRYLPRSNLGRHANDAMPRKEPHYLRGNSAYMRFLRHRGVLALSPPRRRALARHAARVRWRNGGSPHGTASPGVR
jgi:hypothetical protein